MARHLIVLKNIKNVFIRLNHPKSISFVRLNGKIISENTNISILSFVATYLFLFIIGTIIVVLNGVDPVSASSSVASCMAAIGPGLGTVGPCRKFCRYTLFEQSSTESPDDNRKTGDFDCLYDLYEDFLEVVIWVLGAGCWVLGAWVLGAGYWLAGCLGASVLPWVPSWSR